MILKNLKKTIMRQKKFIRTCWAWHTKKFN
jgi:hypothetical protein